MVVNDSLLNDIEFKTNELIIKEYGREIYNDGPLKIYCAFSESISCYSFLAEHLEDVISENFDENNTMMDKDWPVEVKIDLSQFQSVI